MKIFMDQAGGESIAGTHRIGDANLEAGMFACTRFANQQASAAAPRDAHQTFRSYIAISFFADESSSLCGILLKLMIFGNSSSLSLTMSASLIESERISCE